MSDVALVGGRLLLPIPKHTPLLVNTNTDLVHIETTMGYDLKVRAFFWE